jgi:hypothetical protein
MAQPRIHYCAPAWNEGLMLPFMLRHYAPWIERFVIYDSDSTDGSLELLRRMPNVEIRKLSRTQPDSIIGTMRDVRSNCWKESRGTADSAAAFQTAWSRLPDPPPRDAEYDLRPARHCQQLEPSLPDSAG